MISSDIALGQLRCGGYNTRGGHDRSACEGVSERTSGQSGNLLPRPVDQESVRENVKRGIESVSLCESWKTLLHPGRGGVVPCSFSHAPRSVKATLTC